MIRTKYMVDPPALEIDVDDVVLNNFYMFTEDLHTNQIRHRCPWQKINR